MQIYMKPPQTEAGGDAALGRAYAVGAAVMLAALGTVAVGVWPGLIANLVLALPLG